VFRPLAQFPAVIENMDVEWKVSFLGNGDGDLGSVTNWLSTFFAQWLPSAAALSLSIPPDREKLWKAFYKAMTTKQPNKTIREGKNGLVLGDENTNEFEIIFTHVKLP